MHDNGMGFDVRYADKLFGGFQRFHRREVFEGAGVDLVVVQRVIQRHDGHVRTEAAPDRGANFYCTLKGEAKP